MHLSEAVENYLKAKTKKATDFIESRPMLSELDESKISHAISLGAVVAPSLDMAKDKRLARAVHESPTYFPSSMMMQTGNPRQGIEVSIPVEGDFELLTTFIGQRPVCDGFRLTHKSIVIKQYDFFDRGVEDVKDRVKACVESLQMELAELGLEVDFYNARLKMTANVAAQERKQEILAKQQKDIDADPWG